MSAGFALSLNPFTDAGNAILRTIESWVQHGAASAIREVAGVISVTTTPQLTSSWFSGVYWRVAGLATLLTVPFLLAAALQAVIRSDLALLGRAAFGYLPLALIGVGIASPITMLLLSATDEMSAVVSGLAVGGGSHFLTQMAAGFVTQSDPFYALIAELIAVGAAIMLAIELLVRGAAVYIVVLMLPLAFAALVWPARRVWVVRLLELLAALIVSKFVIVAVLSLAGAAYGHSGLAGMSRVLLSTSLLLLAAFAPWAMLQLLPFTELAAAAGGVLSQEVRGHVLRPITDPVRQALHDRLLAELLGDPAESGAEAAATGVDAATAITTRMRAEEPAAERPRSLAEGRLLTQGLGDDGAGADLGAASSADAPASRRPGPAEGGERLPGMDAIWQADDGAWPEMRLGPDGWGGPADYIPPPGDDDEPGPGAPEPPDTPEPKEP